jgi:hypothetical protein
MVSGATLTGAVLSASNSAMHRGIVRCFLWLCALAAVAAIGLDVPSPADWRKPVFPFSEPSMFAVAFIPALMYVAVSSRGWTRVAFMLIGVACTALIQNLTLAIGFALVAAVSLRWYVLATLFVVVVAAASQLDLTYYADRLDFSGDVTNLSNLVYVQGWQMISESWQRSSAFGIGFQQLGVFGTNVPAAQVIRALRAGEDSNLLDGGFVFAKLGSDFGVFGLLLAVVFLGLAFRSFRELRRTASGLDPLPPAVIFAHCVVLSYVIELFVRGAGYFTPGSLLLITALGILGRPRRRPAMSAVFGERQLASG